MEWVYTLYSKRQLHKINILKNFIFQPNYDEQPNEIWNNYKKYLKFYSDTISYKSTYKCIHWNANLKRDCY